jgi:hypothetical protein
MNIKLETLAEILTVDQDLMMLLGPNPGDTIQDLQNRLAFITNHDNFVYELFKALKKLHGACLVLSKVEIEAKQFEGRKP